MISIEELEKRWLNTSELLQKPQKLIKPVNIQLVLRSFRKSISELERYNKTKPQVKTKGNNKTYSEQEILAFWDELHKRQDLNISPKGLKILTQESIFKRIDPILSDERFIELIKSSSVLVTPLWLKRYYFFFFDVVYLSENKLLIQTWAELIGYCFDKLIKDGDFYRNGEVKARYTALVSTLSETVGLDGLLPDLYNEYMEKLLEKAPQSSLENIKSLENYYRQSLGFDVLPSGIRLYCQKHLFNIYLSQYLKDKQNTKVLSYLLEQFCQMDTTVGREHLIKLVTAAYGSPSDLKKLHQPTRSYIQTFLLKSIQDPRLNNASWLSLRSRNKQVYDALRYWFVEADFDLFFEFAFRHSKDDHKRKELWGRFLKQAHDFRVFLPPISYQEFKSHIKDENRHAQVYKNYDNITGFIMCIENLVIYEAVETGNSAYIYDIDELESKSSQSAKKVVRFLSHLYEENSIMKATGSREALAHTGLAPLPTESTRGIKSRRFVHNYNLIWHDQVLDYLKRNYLIVPDNLD